MTLRAAEKGLRRVLIITQHFPPSPEVAGKVTARLIRYVAEFGWEATVLTVPETDALAALDQNAYADVLRMTRVERVGRWPGMPELLRVAVRLRKSLASVRWQDPGPPEQDEVFPRQDRSGRMNRLRRALLFPDSKAGWIAPAVLRARKLMARAPSEAILTISPPHSTHLVGWVLHRLDPSLQWIAHFHDAWLYGRKVGGPLSFLERRVVCEADEVLLATDETADTYAARYSDLSRDKFGVLPNGYDPADFSEVGTSSAPGGARPIRFMHLGTIYGGRNPEPFLRGLGALIGSGSIDSRSVRVELIGSCKPDSAMIVKAIRDTNLEQVVTLSPPIDYPEALRRMRDADVLLLLAQQQPEAIPAKLYEYLCSQRFVLAFTEGATARLIRQTGGGRVVGPTDDVAAVLRELFEEWRSGRLGQHAVPEEKLRPFQARNLAGELADRLDRLTAGLRCDPRRRPIVR